MNERIKGELEIDRDRGVVYFHSNKGVTILRICRLPKPIPPQKEGVFDHMFMDITHMVGCSYQPSTTL